MCCVFVCVVVCVCLCALSAARCSLFAAGCSLRVACCVMSVGRDCLLLLFDVCRNWCLVLNVVC